MTLLYSLLLEALVSEELIQAMCSGGWMVYFRPKRLEPFYGSHDFPHDHSRPHIMKQYPSGVQVASLDVTSSDPTKKKVASTFVKGTTIER